MSLLWGFYAIKSHGVIIFMCSTGNLWSGHEKLRHIRTIKKKIIPFPFLIFLLSLSRGDVFNGLPAILGWTRTVSVFEKGILILIHGRALRVLKPKTKQLVAVQQPYSKKYPEVFKIIDYNTAYCTMLINTRKPCKEISTNAPAIACYCNCSRVFHAAFSLTDVQQVSCKKLPWCPS